MGPFVIVGSPGLPLPGPRFANDDTNFANVRQTPGQAPPPTPEATARSPSPMKPIPVSPLPIDSPWLGVGGMERSRCDVSDLTSRPTMHGERGGELLSRRDGWFQRSAISLPPSRAGEPESLEGRVNPLVPRAQGRSRIKVLNPNPPGGSQLPTLSSPSPGKRLKNEGNSQPPKLCDPREFPGETGTG